MITKRSRLNLNVVHFHCFVSFSKWLREPDLWIGALPKVVRHVDAANIQEQAEETEAADMITVGARFDP